MGKTNRTAGGVSVHVKGKNLSITPALRDQVMHKMTKLDKYLDRLQEIEVELCTEKTRVADHHNQVEATTHVLGRTIRVTAMNSDMYAAIDEAVDKLYRQLNRKKERVKAHHNGKLAETVGLADLATVPEGEEAQEQEPDEPVIRVELLEMKPQFEDEAIEEMEAQGKTFFVFLNARNEQVNVVYRHKDGTYGLIEPGVR
jgi:putative sigma-54 modulation protein